MSAKAAFCKGLEFLKTTGKCRLKCGFKSGIFKTLDFSACPE